MVRGHDLYENCKMIFSRVRCSHCKYREQLGKSRFMSSSPCTLMQIFIQYKDVWIYPYCLSVSLPDCYIQFKWQCDTNTLYLYICTYISLSHFSNICNSFNLISMHCIHNFTAPDSAVCTEPLPQVLLKVPRCHLICSPEHFYCRSSASHPNSAKQQESSSQFPR